MGSIVPALNILISVLSDTSYALLVGALLAGYWLYAVAARSESGGTTICGGGLRRTAVACLAVLIGCHLVRPWFVASSMSGSTQFRATLALVPTILSATRQGGLWYANSVALAVLLAAQFLVKARAASIAGWMEIAALGVLSATKAASSHASEDGDFSLAEISQFLHLLATAVWAGAILVSGLLVVPRLAVRAGPSLLWSYGSRLSKTVTLALTVLVLSGLYAAWRDMHGAISTLYASEWGKILLTKGAFVGLAVVLGSLTRFRCLGRAATSDRAATMTNLLRTEAAVMVAILCISGLLANTNPGS